MGNMQDTDAEQPTIPSYLECSSSDHHILVYESISEDITADEYSHKYELGHLVSIFAENWYVMKITETEKQMEQLIGD